MFLAYEEECSQRKLVGVFIDKQMAKDWVAGKVDVRSIQETQLLDKTFSQMAVAYNTKYEQ